jgi:hypothetical protein
VGAELEYWGYGFRARSLSDKIDFVNFAQSSRPGMTAAQPNLNESLIFPSIAAAHAA